MRAFPLLSAIALCVTIGSVAQAQAVSQGLPSAATAAPPSHPSRAVPAQPVYQTEASRKALATQLVALINEGRCERARSLAENHRDRSFEMTRRVAYFCDKGRQG